MGYLAWTFGTLGGLSAVGGVLTALKVIPVVADLPYLFWLAISVILLLICIAFSAGQTHTTQ